jgi:hypothetical protein
MDTKGLLWFIIIILLLGSLIYYFSKDKTSAGLQYVYQEPSPVNIYSEGQCLKACSQEEGNKEDCDWCQQETAYLGLDKENAKNIFKQFPPEYVENCLM